MIWFVGGADPGPLPVVPSAVQQERTRFPRNVHPDRDARNPGVRRAGRDERLHLHPLHGHEVHPHRQEVSARCVRAELVQIDNTGEGRVGWCRDAARRTRTRTRRTPARTRLDGYDKSLVVFSGLLGST